MMPILCAIEQVTCCDRITTKLPHRGGIAHSGSAEVSRTIKKLAVTSGRQDYPFESMELQIPHRLECNKPNRCK